jgi:hypothetical protein
MKLNITTLKSVKTYSGAHPAYSPEGTVGSFLGAKEADSVKLTTHLYLVPNLRMVGL